MGVPKYNYDELKQKYFASKILDVKTFCEEVIGNYTGTLRTKTTGWRGEKDNYVKNAMEQARQEAEIKKKEQWGLVLDNVDVAHRKALQDLSKKIMEGEVQVSEILSIVKHFKLEKGEATGIVKGEHNLSSLEQLHNENYGGK